MQLLQAEHAPTQFVVTKERRQIVSHRVDQSVVNRDRHVVAEERSFQRRWIISGAGAKDIRLHRIRQRRRQSELVILKFLVELMERAFPQAVVAFHEKRAEGTLSERLFIALGRRARRRTSCRRRSIAKTYRRSHRARRCPARAAVLPARTERAVSIGEFSAARFSIRQRRIFEKLRERFVAGSPEFPGS